MVIPLLGVKTRCTDKSTAEHYEHTYILASCLAIHYENMPMEYTVFLALRTGNFQLKFFNIFLIFAQNIDCGYTLEPPRRGGSIEYPQSMFWSKNKKNR